MIKAFGDYDKVQGYAEGAMLPKGGYVLKILGVETCTNSNGEYLKIGCDVAEGDYANHFANDYKAQQGEDKKWRCNYLLSIPKDDGSERDGWTKRVFKTFTEALEDSNEGYHFDWDEQKFKGKLIGGLFNEREYVGRDGATKRATNFARPIAVSKIRSGEYKLPQDKLLDNSQVRPAGGEDTGFVNAPGLDADNLPF